MVQRGHRWAAGRAGRKAGRRQARSLGLLRLTTAAPSGWSSNRLTLAPSCTWGKPILLLAFYVLLLWPPRPISPATPVPCLFSLCFHCEPVPTDRSTPAFLGLEFLPQTHPGDFPWWLQRGCCPVLPCQHTPYRPSDGGLPQSLSVFGPVLLPGGSSAAGRHRILCKFSLSVVCVHSPRDSSQP